MHLNFSIVLHQAPKGFAALVILTTFLLGTLLFFLGLIGEYVGRIYEETKDRPHYIIRRPLAAEILPRPFIRAVKFFPAIRKEEVK